MEIEAVVKTLSTQKTPGHNDFPNIRGTDNPTLIYIL